MIVPNIDPDQLEKQRKLLRRVLWGLGDKKQKLPSKRSLDELEGLLNMLDYWSDEAFFAARGDRKEGPHHIAVEVRGCSRTDAEKCLQECFSIIHGVDGRTCHII